MTKGILDRAKRWAKRFRSRTKPHAGTRQRVEKRPLQRDLPSPAQFPVEALGEILGGAAQALEQAIQAPLAICGNSVLAAAHFAAQAHVDVDIDGRRFPACEFFLTAGGSGERKTAVDNQALIEHRAHEKRLHDCYRAELDQHKAHAEAFEKVRGQALTAKHGTVEERVNAALQVGPEPLPPRHPVIISEEPTFEGLLKNLSQGQPSQGIFSDEGARFLSSHAMSSENSLGTLAGFSKLWDGSPVDRVRAGDGAVKLYGRRLGFHLMAQPAVLWELISNPQAQDQGFLSRCLIVTPESTIGNRFYNGINPAASAAMVRYHERMRQLLEREPIVEDAGDPARRSQLKPRALSVSAGAKKIYVDFHDTVERAMAAALKELRAFANKGPEHMLRVAAVLALVEDPDTVEIGPTHAAAARKLLEYYLQEAHRLHEAARQDKVLSLAQRLLEWIQELDRPVSIVEIYQVGPSQLRNARTARQIARVLVEHGHLEPVRGVEYRSQVRSEGWRVVR